jgi:galactokinase
MAEASVAASAPGRVNLIGEHTDYNDGFVLPTATPQRTRALLTPRPDRVVHASTANLEADRDASYRLGDERPGRGWLDYVQGVTHVLAQAGHRLGGFDLRLESDVPLGSGLSSSAALEISLLRALRQAFALDVDDLALARLGQRAENEFVGARVGIMDQMAAMFSDTTAALFLDTRSLEFRRVALPRDADLVVIHSGVVHRHAGNEYNARRADCERACQLLGVRALRDLTPDDLPRLDALPERIRRRARHVITENDRVVRFVRALEAGDVAQLGALLVASHASLRDDYEVSAPAVDLLVDVAREDDDVYGARITGGGFGGAVVLLARPGRGRAVGQRLLGPYAARSGEQPTLLIPDARG